MPVLDQVPGAGAREPRRAPWETRARCAGDATNAAVAADAKRDRAEDVTGGDRDRRGKTHGHAREATGTRAGRVIAPENGEPGRRQPADPNQDRERDARIPRTDNIRPAAGQRSGTRGRGPRGHAESARSDPVSALPAVELREARGCVGPLEFGCDRAGREELRARPDADEDPLIRRWAGRQQPLLAGRWGKPGEPLDAGVEDHGRQRSSRAAAVGCCRSRRRRAG